jgi:pimeloyl-ACP methyl ester carboxylesterase
MPLTAQGTAYESFGHEDRVIALIHGLGLNRHSWQWQVPALAQSHRVITFDIYGHGQSAEPPSTPNLTLLSEQLAALLDHLQIASASIFGFSLGGMIARRFTMDHHERVEALGILHSAHERNRPAEESIKARVEQAAKDGPAATVEAALQRWFTDSFRLSHPMIMAQVRDWILANRKEIYAPIYQVLVDGVAELVAPNPPITAPTLVMTGQEDHGNSPAMSRAIAAEIPGAELVILPGLRHMALAEAPDIFNAKLLSFMARVQND